LKPKPTIPNLDGPLSIVTRDMDVPVRDMGAWVNRSLDERRAEVTKKKGYITRPMNSFMLYRSAYSERTKAWCTANNHQIVSSVSGASWPLEPASVREFYSELSKTERARHAEAFPEYKFQPAKPGQKRGHTQEPEVEPGNTSDPDGDWAMTHGVRKTRPRRDEYSYNPMPERSMPSPAPSKLDNDYYHSPSVYDAVRPITAPYLPPREIYPEAQQHLLRYHPMPISHVVTHHPIQGLSYNLAQMSQQRHMLDITPIEEDNGGFVGLPDGSYHELGQHTFGNPALDTLEPSAAIDPMLHTSQFDSHLPKPTTDHLRPLPYQLNYHHGDYSSVYDTNEHGSDPARVATSLAPQGKYEPQQWKPDIAHPVLESLGEFDQIWEDSAHAHATEVPHKSERRPSDIRSANSSNGSRPASAAEVRRILTTVPSTA